MNTNETKIKLEFPITSGGVLVQEITMRRVKVKDQLAVQKTGGSGAEQEVRLIANLANLAPTDIEELDCADYKRVQETLQSFMSPKREDSAELQ